MHILQPAISPGISTPFHSRRLISIVSSVPVRLPATRSFVWISVLGEMRSLQMYNCYQIGSARKRDYLPFMTLLLFFSLWSTGRKESSTMSSTGYTDLPSSFDLVLRRLLDNPIKPQSHRTLDCLPLQTPVAASQSQAQIICMWTLDGTVQLSLRQRVQTKGWRICKSGVSLYGSLQGLQKRQSSSLRIRVLMGRECFEF
jgi:hypothetical protein